MRSLAIVSSVALVAAACVAMPATPSLAQPYGFDVQVNQSWQPTGLFVDQGDIVCFQAAGQWYVSNPPPPPDCNLYDPDGLCAKPDSCFGGNPAVECLAGAGYLVPGVSRYSAVAKIGSCEGFFIGVSRELPAPCSGEISLAVNDDFLPDNSGSLKVLITPSCATPVQPTTWGAIKTTYD